MGASIVADIRRALRAAADPSRAAGQQAYMKSAMPFLGVTVPDARRIARAAAEHETDAAALRSDARTLWDEASHREERYAAVALLALPATEGELDDVPLIEHMVRTGRWWDFTDELAHRIAALLDEHPRETDVLVRAWAVDQEVWMRRLAILSQLGRGERLDRDLLAEVIERNRYDGEFFIRKAIGWALREYARVDADWVRAFVDTHDLSPLTRREALKHIA